MRDPLSIEPGFFDDAPADPWRTLWRCVLIQAARDSAMPQYQSEIALWLDHQDFISVCLNSGYDDPDVLKAGIRRIMATGTVHADPAARRRRIDGARQARIDRQEAKEAAMQELDQRIVALRAEGRPYSEIGQMLDVSATTVGVRLKVLRSAKAA